MSGEFCTGAGYLLYFLITQSKRGGRSRCDCRVSLIWCKVSFLYLSGLKTSTGNPKSVLL